MTEFSLQWSESLSREQLAIINARRPYRIERECCPGLIPIGDVPYCEAVFGQQPLIKDFYPEFLCSFRRRQIAIAPITRELSGGLQAGAFIKDATSWKADQGARISVKGEPIATPHWLSELVTFVDEWRYYVADGKVHGAWWYQGANADELAPHVDIEWPAGFSGAVDFGRLADGSIALVEAHAPFACGWYGDDPMQYADWMAEAWMHRNYWLKDDAE